MKLVKIDLVVFLEKAPEKTDLVVFLVKKTDPIVLFVMSLEKTGWLVFLVMQLEKIDPVVKAQSVADLAVRVTLALVKLEAAVTECPFEQIVMMFLHSALVPSILWRQLEMHRTSQQEDHWQDSIVPPQLQF
jgi:hypothetical protein